MLPPSQEPRSAGENHPEVLFKCKCWAHLIPTGTLCIRTLRVSQAVWNFRPRRHPVTLMPSQGGGTVVSSVSLVKKLS